MNDLRLLIFVVITLLLLVFSWRDLNNPRVHGFYRFFAFEAIVALMLLNLNNWFRSPFSVLQIFSWIFLTASLILAIHGFSLLHSVGKPQHGIENTTILVTRGAYRFIRHPLYCSLILLSWGIFLKEISIMNLIFAFLSTALLERTAKVEEKENLIRFGIEYEDYMKGTKKFIPFVW